MLDIKFIRKNTKAVKEAAKNKGYKVDIDGLLKLDVKRRSLLVKIENLRTKQNKISNNKKGKPTESEIINSKIIKKELEEILPEFDKIDQEYQEILFEVPNLPSKDSPLGKDVTDNLEIKRVGEIPKFSFDTKNQVELGNLHNLMDNERAVKIGGTRSYIIKNEMVILEQSVLRYAIDVIKAEGFEIMNVPVLVKGNALVGSGFFPFGKEDVYKVGEDEYLVGTSEASLVYYHSGEVLEESFLPRLLSGITPCFRKEVGTYGKDTQGIFRVHQFNKVEQVVLCREEDSEKMFDYILGIAEKIVSSIGLPYRIINTAVGDMGAKNIKMYDIEVWFPSQKTYRETHSCSYLGDYQARRANIKFRDSEGNKKFVHTLNNTGVATPRILGAILENFQQKDGSIKIPDVLQKYTGFKEIK